MNLCKMPPMLPPGKFAEAARHNLYSFFSVTIMHIDAFLKKLNDTPESVTFDDTMACINASYEFTPAAFTNGAVRNEAGQNSGSCKLFAFASLNKLTEAQTLACFGAFYRDDVLKHPEGTDHQNIRNFMRTGWAGVKFDSMPLRPLEAA